MWKYMQITWVKAKKEFVLQGIKSYIHLELSNAGKCTLDLVMRPDRRILWSRAHISWRALVRQAPSESQGVERTKPTLICVRLGSQAQETGTRSTLCHPHFPICICVLLCYQTLQMELPVPLLIITIIFISSPIMSPNLLALELLSLLDRNDSLLRG